MLDQVLERIPELRSGLSVPVVFGTAALTSMAFAGRSLSDITSMVAARDSAVARAYDLSIVHQLAFRKAEGLALQAEVLATQQLFRIASSFERSIRLLCLMAPGDLMINAPLDFITSHLDVQLDLLYVLPGTDLPPAMPEHDIAFFGISEADPATQARLQGLYRTWPRPVLNDPGHLGLFARDALAAALAGIAPVCCARTARMARADVVPSVAGDWDFPLLIRPLGSHAGTGLARLTGMDETIAYLMSSDAPEFFLSAFIDYRSEDGLFRKYRVAFIDGVPHLCHMAVSEHWMVHYLNAGMTESAEKRADEARAMANFHSDFARRHQAAFDALNRLFQLDYYSIDCAETAHGKLLVFEADTGAIIHMMDPPDLFPYKRPQMQRVFAAFDAMLRRRSVKRPTPTAPSWETAR